MAKEATRYHDDRGETHGQKKGFAATTWANSPYRWHDPRLWGAAGHPSQRCPWRATTANLMLNNKLSPKVDIFILFLSQVPPRASLLILVEWSIIFESSLPFTIMLRNNWQEWKRWFTKNVHCDFSSLTFFRNHNEQVYFFHWKYHFVLSLSDNRSPKKNGGWRRKRNTKTAELSKMKSNFEKCSIDDSLMSLKKWHFDVRFVHFWERVACPPSG